MIVEWTESARKRFKQIQSDHFTTKETIAYKIKLIQRVEAKVVLMGKSMPSREYRNTYYCMVDRYIVSYKVLDNGERYTITSFKHGAMNREF